MTKDEALRLALEALEGAYARLVTKCEQNLVTYNGVDVDTLTLSQEAITAIKEVLAQPQPWEKFCDSNCVWTDHHPDCKLAEQESVTWRNAAIRVGEDLCSVGPFGYYDMTAEQWLDWALSVVTVHAPPPQRKPLTDEEIDKIYEAHHNQYGECESVNFGYERAIEAKLKEKNTWK